MTHTDAVNSLAVERYLLSEMSDAERDVFEAHFFECRECAEEVRAGALMREGAKAGFLSRPQLAPFASATPARQRTVTADARAAVAGRWYRSAAFPWAVAATLALAVGYQSFRATAGLPAQPGALEAVSTVTLRPVSRGAVPTVSVSSSRVALALDVDAGGTMDVLYELRDPSAALLGSGRAPSPMPGSPLLLVIQSFTLKPQQQYILTVRDANAPDRVLGEFPFAATP